MPESATRSRDPEVYRRRNGDQAAKMPLRKYQPAGPVLVSGLRVWYAHGYATNIWPIRYNRPDGTVHVGLTETGTLTVRNTGPDVAADRVPMARGAVDGRTSWWCTAEQPPPQ